DLDYVDLLLIHAPSRSVPIHETIGAMNELQDQGTVNHIGVSNFSPDQCREAMEASSTTILTNQIKYNPFNTQNEQLEFCVERNVILTAHTPLARTRVKKNRTIREIGKKYGKSPHQVTLRWLIQQPMVCAIPKSQQPDHQKQNLDIFDFELDDDDMERMFSEHGGIADTLKSFIGM
ncbi:MAG: aldo/keto reductase, partial [bacterium]